MELRILRYFLAVAREQNITKAAESLHITQPTLSKQLMDLEDELGKKLFVRGSRKITLTEEGEFLRQRAQEIVSLAEKTQAALTSEEKDVAGDLYIGCGETEGMRILVRAMKELSAAYPQIRYHLYSGNDEDVSLRLNQGLVDFGLFVGETDLEKYDYIKLPYADIWGLLLRKDHPLAARSSIAPHDLEGIPLLCSRQTLERNELSGWLGRDFGQLSVLSTHNLIRNVTIMVEEGLGAAVTIDRLVNTEGTQLTFRPFEPPVTADSILAWKKHRILSKPAEKFLEFLQKVV